MLSFYFNFFFRISGKSRECLLNIPFSGTGSMGSLRGLFLRVFTTSTRTGPGPTPLPYILRVRVDA